MIPSVRSIHFVGIGGTAMASAAAAMKQRGFEVSGSDQNVYPPMSSFLAEQGIDVWRGYKEEHLAHEPDLVVIGNAISRGNPEAEAVLDQKLLYCSLPELLKDFFLRGKRSVVVCGTHGKTTTTALLTWVFERSGLNPSYLIGGIPNNFTQGARFTESEWFIIEGDEYDTAFFDKRSKFVHYLPEVGIINNLEFDHADIFGSLDEIKTSFRRFINLIPRKGLLLGNGDDPNLLPLLKVSHCSARGFGLGAGNDVRAEQLKLGEEWSEFSLGAERYRVPLVGELNVRNALAVAAAARWCGLSADQIQSGFESFQGVKRRMEERGSAGEVTVLDDFGHHPTALRETMRALRLRYPGRRLWAVFEPRTNTTRRNVFQRELKEALAEADCVVVAAVARLELLDPEDRLDPDRLMRELEEEGTPSVYLPSVESIVEHVSEQSRPGDVVCVFSNGGFGGIHEKLLERLGMRVKVTEAV